MMSARYAIYYVPEEGSSLDVLGSGLLGRNAAGADVPRLRMTLPGSLNLGDITTAPRHYGLHATLKAPFALAPGGTEAQVCEALGALAQDYPALLLPPLAVGTVPNGKGGQGTFLALRPEAPCTLLNAFAERCVRDLDPFRAPLSAEDAARRKNLTPRQQENLGRWGYPHVLKDFYFHITLTDSLEDPMVRASLAEALGGIFTGVCAPHRILMRHLALVRQPDRQHPFHLVATFPFNPLA